MTGNELITFNMTWDTPPQWHPHRAYRLQFASRKVVHTVTRLNLALLERE